MSSPDHTLHEPTSPDASPERPAALPRRLRAKAAAALRELWTALAGTGADTGPHRLPPRMRTAQIGTAAVAIGVLGAVLGTDGPPPDTGPGSRPAPSAAGRVQPGPESPPSSGPGLGSAAADPVGQWVHQATAVLEAPNLPRD